MRGLTLGDPALLGGLGFNPLSLSPALWLDASDTSTITSSGSPAKVSQWNDKSGNGRNVTQPTGTAQPGTGSTTQNGLNVLTFDGNDALDAATAADWKFLHDGTNYIVAAVVKWGNVASPKALYPLLSTFNSDLARVGMWVGIDDRAARTKRLRHVVGNGSGTASVGNESADNATSTNAATVFSLLSDPDNATAASRSSMFNNGGSAIANNTLTTAVSTSNPQNFLTIGVIPAVPTAYALVGFIAEIVIVSGANATEANRVALRDYLNAKWAVY